MNNDERRQMREDIGRVQFKIVDAAGQIADAVASRFTKPAQGRKAPAQIARRQIANLLRTSQFCANKACRRTHCCRGEPLHCLQSVITLLPPEAFDGLLKNKRLGMRAKRGRQGRQ